MFSDISGLTHTKIALLSRHLCTALFPKLQAVPAHYCGCIIQLAYTCCVCAWIVQVLQCGPVRCPLCLRSGPTFGHRNTRIAYSSGSGKVVDQLANRTICRERCTGHRVARRAGESWLCCTSRAWNMNPRCDRSAKVQEQCYRDIPQLQRLPWLY